MTASQELALAEGRAVQPQSMFSLAPRNLEEAFRLADMLAESDLVPKDFKGKPGNCMIAIQWGAEVGLKPLQSLQNIAVINGRPCLWGDALIALVRSSPLCEWVLEEMDAAGTAVCRVKRRGEPEQTRTFSTADAKTAGLLGKQGPWQSNPSRMKQMRARAFALRDVFPDVLKGIPMAEEVMDFTESLQPATPLRPAAPAAPPVDPQVLADAQAAADKGRESFAQWWKAATPAQRRALADNVADLKDRTERADAARTVDAQPPEAELAAQQPMEPEAPVDPWIADLEAAQGSQP